MRQLWKDEVLAESANGSVIAVNQWLARLTLDIIGEGDSLFLEFAALS